jgi:hypothetical protein
MFCPLLVKVTKYKPLVKLAQSTVILLTPLATVKSFITTAPTELVTIIETLSAFTASNSTVAISETGLGYTFKAEMLFSSTPTAHEVISKGLLS